MQPTQGDAREYLKQCLAPYLPAKRSWVDDYIDASLDDDDPADLVKLKPEAVREDFEIFLEVLSDLGDEALAEATSPKVEHPVLTYHVDLPEPKVGSTPGFVCDLCGTWFPENKGWLSHDGSLHAVPALHDKDCIDSYHLVLEPEEKDRHA